MIWLIVIFLVIFRWKWGTCPISTPLMSVLWQHYLNFPSKLIMALIPCGCLFPSWLDMELHSCGWDEPVSERDASSQRGVQTQAISLPIYITGGLSGLNRNSPEQRKGQCFLSPTQWESATHWTCVCVCVCVHQESLCLKQLCETKADLMSSLYQNHH